MAILLAILATVIAVVVVFWQWFLTRRSVRYAYEPLASPSPPTATFEARWPRSLLVDTWQPFWVYMYVGWEGYHGYREDLRRRVDALVADQDVATAGLPELQPGVELWIVPQFTGVAFNPEIARLRWLEPWHCAEFRIKAIKPSDPAITHHAGTISLYATGILVADINISLRLTEVAPSDQPLTDRAEARRYRDIFVSYSHEDTTVVDYLETAYRALGDSYLRDVHILRSGECWNEALAAAIQQADIFQLCWSNAASNSTFVRSEWQHALSLRRRQFIRPVYWQRPLPIPPPELADIHFAYLPLNMRLNLSQERN